MATRIRVSYVAIVALGAAIVAVAGGIVLGDPAGDPSGKPAKPLPTIDLTGGPAFPLDKHVESKDVAAGAWKFDDLFEAGSKLFHAEYNGLDGVGMSRLPDGSTINRFSIVPPGGGALTRVSAQSCGGCHGTPFRSSAGPAETDVAFDLGRAGKPPFVARQTTSLFGDGILQLLAQEITEDLQSVRDDAARAARAKPGTIVRLELKSKGVNYGALAATADPEGGVSFDLSGVQGVDPDLVVRPFGWKGNVTTLRTNVVGPALVLMGMQPEEVVWKGPNGGADPDPDGDGVARELSVGDITAMTIYNAALETPTSVERLAELGMVAPPDAATLAKIERGRSAFERIGCAGCHVSEMKLSNTEFDEPTARGNGQYYDRALAAKDPSYDPAHPMRFDVLKDAKPPRAEAGRGGGAVIRLYGDLKRHDMGRRFADPGPQPPITPEFAPLSQGDAVVLIAPSVFLTAELWGVGNTGPWLHDGRAGTLEEAIRLHGEDAPPAVGQPGRSEAQEARDAFVALAPPEREAVVTFLRSLRTFSREED